MSFANKLKGDRGGSVSRRDTGIEYDPNSPNNVRATVNVTIKSDHAGNVETVAHEGSHVADRQEFVASLRPDGTSSNPALNITLRQSEIRAYQLSIGLALAGNKTQNFGACGLTKECKFTPSMMPAMRDQLINDLLNTQYKNEPLDHVLFPEFQQ